MRQTDSIIPVKKTQSRFLDQLIQQQCTVNERNRVIHEQTMHLKNSMIPGDSNHRHNHYYSQTASSQAKKKLYNNKSGDHANTKAQRKQRKVTTLTQPKAFQFYSSARSSLRDKQQTKLGTNQDENQNMKKIIYSSSAKPIQIEKDMSKRSKSVSGISKPKAHLTKVVGFSFATESRFHKKSETFDTQKSVNQVQDCKASKLSNRQSSRLSNHRINKPKNCSEKKTGNNSQSFRRHTNSTRLSQRKKSVESIKKSSKKRANFKRNQTFRSFKQSFSKNTVSKDMKTTTKREINQLTRYQKSARRRSVSTAAQSQNKKQKLSHSKLPDKMERKPLQEPKVRRNITRCKSVLKRQTHAKKNMPVVKNNHATNDGKQLNEQPSNSDEKTVEITSKKPRGNQRKRRLSLTESQMRKMLNHEISSNETTDWNKMYVQANRKRSRSLTRSSSRSSLSHRNSSGISGTTRRRRGRSASFNSVKYADFVENYALDALLTDDASRISDEDLKELSRNASENNSINSSPISNAEYNSFGSQLTFAQLLDHDMSMLDSQLVDHPNVNDTSLDSSNGSSNTTQPDDDVIITDVKDRFLKLDHLFGQISAAIEEDQTSWIHT